MKIHVKDEDLSFVLVLPTRLLLSRTVARLVARVLIKCVSEDNVQVDTLLNTLERIFAELRRVKDRHRKWVLLDVTSSDGDRIKIEL